MLDRSLASGTPKNLHLFARPIIASLASSHRWWPYIRGTLALGVHFYSAAKKATYTVDDFSYSHDLISCLFSAPLLPRRAVVSWKPWVLSPLLLTTIYQNDGQMELLIWQKPSSETIYSWGWSVRTVPVTQNRAFPRLFIEVLGNTMATTAGIGPENTYINTKHKYCYVWNMAKV